MKVIGPFLAFILSGLCLTGAFEPLAQPWLAWAAFVPVVAALRCWPPGSARLAFGLGWLMGLVHFSTSLYWITEVTRPGWAVLSAYLALYPGCWVGAMAVWMRGYPGEPRALDSLRVALCGTAWWVVLEWLRGWLLTGFPWNPLGVSQSGLLALAQLAELGGVALVGAVVIFGSLCIGLTLVRVVGEARRGNGPRPHGEFIVALLVVGGAFWFGIGRLTRPLPEDGVRTLEVAVVQPDIPQDPWGSGMPPELALERMTGLTRLVLAGGEAVDLVLWPETPVPEPLRGLPGFGEFVQEVVPERAQAMVYGSITRDAEGNPFNSAVLADARSPEAATYDKLHLVVLGEYVPFARWLPVLRRWVPLGEDFQSGAAPVVFDLPNGLRAAPLICFEDVMSRVVRRFLEQQPDLFLNLTNDGWFNESPQSRQHFENARFRCIEFRRPMIRAGNNGVSGWIDERGVPRQLLADVRTGSTFFAGTLRTEVKVADAPETLYARWGEWWVGLCALGLLPGLVLRLRRRAGGGEVAGRTSR